MVLSINRKLLNVEVLTAWALKVLGMCVVVLAPVRSIMVAVSLLVLLDLITGIMAARKRGEKIVSFKLRKTVVKGFTYQASILVAFLLETYLVPDMPVVKVVAGLVGLTEAKSFFENVHTITGINFWAMILEKLQGNAQMASTLEKTPDDKP